MDKKQQVLLKLKPKVKAFGFSRKELMGVAAKIADNLTSEDNASDEDVNAEIDNQIDAVLPYLQLGQTQASRVISDWKKDHPEIDDDDDEEDDDDEPSSKSNKRQTSSSKSKKNKEEGDAAPEWAKSIMQTVQSLKDEVVTLKGEKTTTTRRSKLEAMLKDAGTFGTRTLKSFSKMNFENDDEFDEFYSEVEEDLKTYNQERADAGLSTMGNPPAAGSGGRKKDEEVLTDSEIDAIVGNL